MKTKDFALEVKDLSEDGTFEGYGSIFGNVDSYGEKVVPGAFVESLAKHRREGTSVLMLWQHNPDEPIGVWDDLAEDAKGLWGKGRLIMEVQRAKEVYALLRAKAVRGLSIGYRELDTDSARGSREIGADGSVRPPAARWRSHAHQGIRGHPARRRCSESAGRTDRLCRLCESHSE